MGRETHIGKKCPDGSYRGTVLDRLDWLPQYVSPEAMPTIWVCPVVHG